MKALIGALAVLILMIGAQSAYALTEYRQGFKRGINDANTDLSQGNTITILKAALDEIFKHPHAFRQGWMDGFCSIEYIGSDADEFTFNCSDESSIKP